LHEQAPVQSNATDRREVVACQLDSQDWRLLHLHPTPSRCPFVASLVLSIARRVCAVLLANRLFLVLPSSHLSILYLPLPRSVARTHNQQDRPAKPVYSRGGACPTTFQRRRCARQTKPMQECHPERSAGSLSGERSLAALRMTKRDGLLFEMYCPLRAPGAGGQMPTASRFFPDGCGSGSRWLPDPHPSGKPLRSAAGAEESRRDLNSHQ